MNDWVNSRETGDLRHDRAHDDITVMSSQDPPECENVRGYLDTTSVMENHRSLVNTPAKGL